MITLSLHPATWMALRILAVTGAWFLIAMALLGLWCWLIGRRPRNRKVA